VTLTASPAPGSTFTGWSGSGCSGAGTCRVTMNSDTTVTATFAHAAPPSPPALSGLKVSPSTFVLAGRLVGGRCVVETRANRKHRHCTRPVKLKVTYRLNVTAAVTVTIKHSLAGRLVALHGTLTRAGAAGPNTFTFHGRIGGRQLGTGSYRLTATPSLSGKTGRPRTITFRLAN
jgi:hypothetical protein